MEKNEPPDHGIVREIYEELHVDANIAKRLGMYLRLWNGDMVIAFLIDAPSQVLSYSHIATYDDAKKAAFFSINTLPSITLRTRRIIDDILNGCSSNLYVFCHPNDTGRLV